MSQFDVVVIQADSVWWRIYEKEMMERHLGPSVQFRPETVSAKDIFDIKPRWVSWKLNTETTDEKLWQRCCRIADMLGDSVRHINDPRGWLNCHAKEVCFRKWRDNGISVPDWFEFSLDDFNYQRFPFPYLLRINNGNTGRQSYLCQNQRDVEFALNCLKTNMDVCYDGSASRGTRRKLICVKFIDTLQENRQVNMSFRIIVAARRVVTGYARVGQPSDWVAITNRFEPWMEEIFVRCNQKCQQFCRDHEDDLVKSVKVLSQTLLGVDVILDSQGNPYWLEVQPGFSVGYTNRSGWYPPFYNPSKPQALVDFLQRDMDRLRHAIPMYTECWLDKQKMFDMAFNAIKESA